MMICIICRFEAEVDDAVVSSGEGRCICLRCYTRETGHLLTVPKRIRNDVIDAINAVAS